MSDYSRPLPMPSRLSEFYWEKCRVHELWIQWCSDCGKAVFFPRSCCPCCQSERLTWRQTSGKGRIFGFSIVHHAFGTAWKEAVPYIAALVELDEGPRLATTISGCERSEVHIGMQVEVVFDDVTDKCSLPRFKPVDGSSDSLEKKEEAS